MAQLIFDKVTKRFDGTVAVDNLDLRVHDGELLVLLGPSGCGKTTALRMVAGLEEVSEGTIRIGERVVNDVEPKDRDVAMVFQSYALYPHLTVAKNIEFPLRQRNVEKAERVRMVTEAAATLGLSAFLNRRPGQLSGGQRQRVALARAIVRSPQAFLMDEPLSNLDAALRTQTRADIVTLQQRLRTTTLYVTHDQVEAMTMGDRIAVMSGGVLQQVAAPQDVYANPANVFVAGFLGAPGMNLLKGTLDRSAGGPKVRVDTGSVPFPARFGAAGASAVVVGFRPEAVSVDAQGTLGATVDIVELLGAEVHVVCRVGDARVVVRQDVTRPRPQIGEQIKLPRRPRRPARLRRSERGALTRLGHRAAPGDDEAGRCQRVRAQALERRHLDHRMAEAGDHHRVGDPDLLGARVGLSGRPRARDRLGHRRPGARDRRPGGTRRDGPRRRHLGPVGQGGARRQREPATTPCTSRSSTRRPRASRAGPSTPP